jgi:hypothetical protein
MANGINKAHLLSQLLQRVVEHLLAHELAHHALQEACELCFVGGEVPVASFAPSGAATEVLELCEEGFEGVGGRGGVGA